MRNNAIIHKSSSHIHAHVRTHMLVDHAYVSRCARLRVIYVVSVCRGIVTRSSFLDLLNLALALMREKDIIKQHNKNRKLYNGLAKY